MIIHHAFPRVCTRITIVGMGQIIIYNRLRIYFRLLTTLHWTLIIDLLVTILLKKNNISINFMQMFG